MQSIVLSASILSADFAHLADDVNAVLAAGVDYIHFDVMDHHYVPNLSFGAVVCQALRAAGITAPIDVHLMVENAEQYITPFARAGANCITFHPSTVVDVRSCIAAIREQGMQVGLAINPGESLDLIHDYVAEMDLLLLMSVNPGFSGQSFIESSFDKISAAHRLLQQHQRPICLAVDGGINVNNIAKLAAVGANFFVLGSGVFTAPNYQERVADIRAQITIGLNQ